MDAKRAVQQLERFHYIGQPTHHGRRVEPFRIAGISIDTFWGEHQHAERLPALEAAIDESCRPSTVAATLSVIEGHDERILQHIVGGGRRQQPPAPTTSRSDPAPIHEQAVPLDVDVDRAVQPVPVTPLLGGVTIKRRRRGAPAPGDADAATPARSELAAPAQPATLPPERELGSAPEPPAAAAPEQRELVEPAAIAPDGNGAGPGEAAPSYAGARRLAPMRRTVAGPGSSPLLDSLEEDLERLQQRARERRDD
ncbi:MAG: hypothetical protein LC790_10265 [Actinobacteria bacterium]|nr:hypothetical protein [Actinomycetota bacterium]